MHNAKNFAPLSAKYPEVALRMDHQQGHGWLLTVKGPYGALTMLTPDIPLRLATLETACQLVSCNNVERKSNA